MEALSEDGAVLKHIPPDECERQDECDERDERDTHCVRRQTKVLIFSGRNFNPATGSLEPPAIDATRGGNETVGAFETDGSLGDSASRQAAIASER
jgi:hypothetical protein